MKFPQRYFIDTKLLSRSTVGIILLVIICVWISGQSSHRSLFQNSIISTSILGTAFLLFISLGLYYGLKLKDNIGHVLTKENIKKLSDKTPEIGNFDFDGPALGDGIGGIIVSIIAWLIFSIVLVFLLYFLGVFFLGRSFIICSHAVLDFFPCLTIGF